MRAARGSGPRCPRRESPTRTTSSMVDRPSAPSAAVPRAWSRLADGARIPAAALAQVDSSRIGEQREMRALSVVPGQRGTLVLDGGRRARTGSWRGELLVDALAMGVCGTDLDEIVGGDNDGSPGGRSAPASSVTSPGSVPKAPTSSGFTAGDLVVGVVRRPDPVPCGACAHGEFDMCRNGRYTERGIKELVRLRQRRLVRRAGVRRAGWRRKLTDVGVLLEPTRRGRQGLGPGREGRASRLVRAAQRPGHRRRADRVAGGDAGRPARSRRARARSGHQRSET